MIHYQNWKIWPPPQCKGGHWEQAEVCLQVTFPSLEGQSVKLTLAMNWLIFLFNVSCPYQPKNVSTELSFALSAVLVEPRKDTYIYQPKKVFFLFILSFAAGSVQTNRYETLHFGRTNSLAVYLVSASWSSWRLLITSFRKHQYCHLLFP